MSSIILTVSAPVIVMTSDPDDMRGLALRLRLGPPGPGDTPGIPRCIYHAENSTKKHNQLRDWEMRESQTKQQWMDKSELRPHTGQCFVSQTIFMVEAENKIP